MPQLIAQLLADYRTNSTGSYYTTRTNSTTYSTTSSTTNSTG